MYKAIGFDWSGVLCGNAGADFDNQMAALLGVGYEEYDGVYKQYNQDFNRGTIDAVTMWKSVLSDLGQLDKIAEALELQSTRDLIDLNDEVVDLAYSLKETGIKLGILSNNTKENAREIGCLPLAKLFDVIHISGETGDAKPERDAYEKFTQALGVGARELVFIDDSEENTKPAKQYGIATIKFDTYEQCIADIKSLGLSA